MPSTKRRFAGNRLGFGLDWGIPVFALPPHPAPSPHTPQAVIAMSNKVNSSELTDPSCPASVRGIQDIHHGGTETQRLREEVSIPVLLTVSPSLWFKNQKYGYPA